MNYIDEYRDKDLVRKLANEIKQVSRKNIKLMEVCGGHTMSIHKFGIPSLLPENIKLLSGPGCPVCVTSRKFIDQSIAYSRLKDVIITTYGDLIRVPGSDSSLDKEKASGADVRIVYSVLDALTIAKENKDKKVIFLGIGFETTAPASAVAVINAAQENIDNFFLFSSHKVMPPAMSALIDEGVKIDGYICPGHVTVITGTEMYEPIVKNFRLGCVVSGFEPLDILQSVLMLVKQIENNAPQVEIQYSRVVKPEGNIKAKNALNEVFEPKDDWWRGFGIINNSGLKLRYKYIRFDVENFFDIHVPEPEEPKGCICGKVLKGLKTPLDCKLFRKVCSPENPVGACMVSNEGSCAAYFKYEE